MPPIEENREFQTGKEEKDRNKGIPEKPKYKPVFGLQSFIPVIILPHLRNIEVLFCHPGDGLADADRSGSSR